MGVRGTVADKQIATQAKTIRVPVRVAVPLLVGGIMVLALALRVWGVGYDLPFVYHPDEPGKVRIALNMVRTGDLNPGYFLKPGFFMYTNALALVPYYLVGKLLGSFQTRADLLAPVTLVMGVTRAPLPIAFLVGRSLSVLFSTLTVLPVYRIGVALRGRDRAAVPVGILGALLLAISPTHVSQSRAIHPDAWVVFFICLVVWFSYRILQQGRQWDYVWAGVSLGLAASSKYNGGFAVVAIIVAHLLRHETHAWRRWEILLSGLVSVGVFIVTNPYALMLPKDFLDSVVGEARHYATGHMGMEGNAFSWYCHWLWTEEGFVVVLAILEILRGLHRRSREHVLLMSFPLFYLVFISLFSVRNPQTVLPIIPLLGVLAASLVIHFVDYALKRFRFSQARRRLSLTVVALLVIVAVAHPLGTSLAETRQLTLKDDSRRHAAQWVQQNLPAGSRIAIEPYTPFLDPQDYDIVGVPGLYAHAPEWYRANGIDYLVFGEDMFGRFYRDPARYGAEIEAYELLRRDFEPVAAFDEGNYDVYVYRVTPDIQDGAP